MTAPTREQVDQWALEAGFTVRNGVVKVVHSNGSWIAVNERLAEFTSLAYAAGQAAEREACAKVCEDFADGTSAYEVHHRFAAYKCADLIRKRGEK